MRPLSFVRYVLRRLAFGLVLVFLASSFSFLLTHLAPGDATTSLVRPGVTPETIARERARLGLDQPLATRYLHWMSRVAALDLGFSTLYRRPVSELLGERIPNTVRLATTALTLATVSGVWLGVVTGSRPRVWSSRVVGSVSMVALSVPSLLASLMLAFMAARTGWFPVGGMSSPALEGQGWLANVLDHGWHLVLPALAIALPLGATIERLQSQSMGDTLHLPYVRAAAARGIPRPRILWAHAFPVAVRPVLGVYGVILGSAFSGSFVVEYVTAWPGLGRLMYEALMARDTTLVAGCALAGSSCLALGTFVADVALFGADPRLREAE